MLRRGILAVLCAVSAVELPALTSGTCGSDSVCESGTCCGNTCCANGVCSGSSCLSVVAVVGIVIGSVVVLIILIVVTLKVLSCYCQNRVDPYRNHDSYGRSIR